MEPWVGVGRASLICRSSEPWVGVGRASLSIRSSESRPPDWGGEGEPEMQVLGTMGWGGEGEPVIQVLGTMGLWRSLSSILHPMTSLQVRSS